jgi:hypothetical protein
MLQSILDEYNALRDMGMDANSALAPLKARIDKLDASDKAELVRRVRDLELRRAVGNVQPTTTTEVKAAPSPAPAKPTPTASPEMTLPVPPVQIKKLTTLGGASGTPPAAPPAAQPAPAMPAELPRQQGAPKAPPSPLAAGLDDELIACPKCGRSSRNTEIFCPFCGTFLQESAVSFQTLKLETEAEEVSPDYFGAQTILVLYIRHNKNQFRIQPQTFNREMIVGRSDATAPVTPDIDLVNQGGGELGVSRMHLSLKYDRTQNTLSAADLRSSNGSFVNNQRLHPNEIRVLRSGDELRLGKLIMTVVFQHPAE